jgi:SAM-dependent methyltransferase
MKWRYYSHRYGRVSSLLRYLGRRCPRIWPLIGKFATSSFLTPWIHLNGARIVNLGGGSNLRDEWLTADMDPRADVFVNCCRPLPFADGSLDCIMLEEVIEHLDYQDGLRLLRECRRILKPDGVLRVSTPDFAWFTKLQSGTELVAVGGHTASYLLKEGGRFISSQGSSTSLLCAGVLNQIFLSHGHRFVYTERALEDTFGLAGFRFRRSHYKDSESKLGRFDSHAERFSHPPEISMYFDAWKDQ